MSKYFSVYIWKKAPFFRLLISLITGIVIGYYLPMKIDSWAIITAIFIICFLLFRFSSETFRFRFRFVQGIIIKAFFVMLGIGLVWLQDVRHHQSWYGNKLSDSDILTVRLLEPPQTKLKSVKVLAQIISVEKMDSSIPASGKVLLYFSKDSVLPSLNYGEVIIIKNKLSPITNSGNPGAFNYQRYLEFQQIYHQAFLKSGEYKKTHYSDKNKFWEWVFASRNYVLEVLNQFIPKEQESSLANALVIGYRADLDKDLIQAYSNAGVVHLIAISGLHLAVIYGLLLWLTLKIPYLKSSPIIRGFVILFCLWFFSFLTGSPPSVMRAATMFSFISIGTLFQKHGSIYNSLSVSAFLLLCFNPFLLWDVGFQLSYLAVLGIVVCQRPIYNLFYFKNKIPDYLWAMASVSIAAQIFTVPVCFYYFHQLPILFLLANMIAIPLSTVALWMCILLIAVSPIPFVATIVGYIAWVFLWLMNHSVLLINQLPFVTWNKISISVWNTFLLYIIFAFILLWLFKKHRISFQLALACIIIFFGSVAFGKWNAAQQKKIIVYHIPTHQAVDFISGNEYFMVSDSALLQNNQLQNYNVWPARIMLAANYTAHKPIVSQTQQGFYEFYKKRIVIIDTAIKFEPLIKRIPVDYLIISRNPKIKINDLNKIFEVGIYIFDGSNGMWRIGEWKKECEDLHLRYHSTSESGAFTAAF